VIFSLNFGCKYGALLQPYILTVGLFWFFFFRRPWILTHLCPHPPSINRAYTSPSKHTSMLSFILSSSLLLSFLYFFSHFGFIYLLSLRVILLVMRSSKNSKKFMLYLRGLAQYTVDKSLRVVNLHALGSPFGSWFFQLLQHFV